MTVDNEFWSTTNYTTSDKNIELAYIADIYIDFPLHLAVNILITVDS